MKFTVLGGSGFIGSALVAENARRGHDVVVPARGDDRWLDGEAGHVIHAAGVTADFRARPLDTVEAAVSLVGQVLRRARFDTLLYLSSSRLYRRGNATDEDTPICVSPADPEDLYDIAKLAGEALCRTAGPRVRIARLSSVVDRDFASDNFLFQLIRAACDEGRILLRSAPESAKDYVLLGDVAPLLVDIAERGTAPSYNIGRGANVSHRDLLAPILAETGARLDIEPGAPTLRAPVLDISRVREEFGFSPGDIVAAIPGLVRDYRNASR